MGVISTHHEPNRNAHRRCILARNILLHSKQTTPPSNPEENVVAIFKQLLEAHKKNIRVMVMEELIGECYGPQALLNGRRITDVTDFKEWLEARLAAEKKETL